MRQLLIDLGLAADGGTSWPAFHEFEPDLPDGCVTVYTTAGTDQGSAQVDGSLLGPTGLQVRVRSNDGDTGWAKADEIQTALAGLAARNVTVGASVYNVWDVLPDDVLPIGFDVPGGRRQLFTFNALMMIDQRS